jgi:hypothetical protein
LKPIPLNPDTETVARRIIWFEPPATALADPVRFMAYAMSHAAPEDMRLIRRYVSDEIFGKRSTMRRRESSIRDRGIIGI